MPDDIDPLSEYMRMVRAINLKKIQLASIERKARMTECPRRKESYELSKRLFEEEIVLLKDEGETYLAMVRDRFHR
ncbi:hypothetical protein [Rhizobium sp. S96]|uniref:hypothetical protein n=1 Tax=Rhizobium sp. S96 TaxID=3055140 RepID=UPI0025AA7443|nr:hypothetical protein [Rhizobium sp. S96]MDM9624034.1 hypothetical protein [Rhizobium sp. S96]